MFFVFLRWGKSSTAWRSTCPVWPPIFSVAVSSKFIGFYPSSYLTPISSQQVPGTVLISRFVCIVHRKQGQSEARNQLFFNLRFPCAFCLDVSVKGWRRSPCKKSMSVIRGIIWKKSAKIFLILVACNEPPRSVPGIALANGLIMHLMVVQN